MISVAAVIPVYNVKKYLSRCLNSVINQTHPFDQIIVVNDGSTDGSQDLCAQFANDNPSIQLINKQNGGLVSAWKKGLKYVKSTYICFIDSDDYVEENYLETLISGLKQDIDMVCMNATQAFDTGEKRLFRINGLDKGVYEIDNHFKGRMISDYGSFIRPIASSRWAKLIRTELVLKCAKYCSEGISYGEDQQLTLGVLLSCKKICVLDEYKYYYQYNNNSILNTYKKNLWPKIELLMSVIDSIPGMKEIPDFNRQYNTQYLLYYSECLRNESYHKSLNKLTFRKMLMTKYIQLALDNYSDNKMRKIDKAIICLSKYNKFYMIWLLLELYKLLYRIRKIPG